MTQQEKNEKLHQFTRKIVSKFVNLHLINEPSSSTTDSVFDYAREVITLALMYAEFHDAIREGDGERLIRCWKFLLPLFKASNRKNYALEALHLLAQYYILLPPRLAQQLAWSRCVNTTGKPGCNIPMDLHMEHLNRPCKMAVANLRANITPKAIVRIGKCIGPLTSMCSAFCHSTDVAPHSSVHSQAKFQDDLKKIVAELTGRRGVFKFISGRKHDTFPAFSGSLLDKLNHDEIIEWMEEKLCGYKIPCI